MLDRSPRQQGYALYHLFGYMLDKDQLPDPNQLPDIEVIPDWWPDRATHWEKWLEITISEQVRRHGRLDLKGDPGLTWDLLSPERTVIKSAIGHKGEWQLVGVGDLSPGNPYARRERRTRSSEV